MLKRTCRHTTLFGHVSNLFRHQSTLFGHDFTHHTRLVPLVCIHTRSLVCNENARTRGTVSFNLVSSGNIAGCFVKPEYKIQCVLRAQRLWNTLQAGKANPRKLSILESFRSTQALVHKEGGILNLTIGGMILRITGAAKIPNCKGLLVGWIFALGFSFHTFRTVRLSRPVYCELPLKTVTARKKVNVESDHTPTLFLVSKATKFQTRKTVVLWQDTISQCNAIPRGTEPYTLPWFTFNRM